MMMKFQNSDEQNVWVSGHTGGLCLLSFSRGKDSISAWINCRRYFDKIVPFYLYLIPGLLSFEEESLDYYEAFFGTKIIRLPHPSLYRMLNNFVFQPPDRLEIIEKAALPNFDYRDVRRVLCEDYGLPENTFYATGVRASDGVVRRMAMKRGTVNTNKMSFAAVYDWELDRCEKEIRAAVIKLPRDYSLWHNTFDGIDYRFLSVIRDKLPEDYAKILDWFPLAKLEIMRYER